MSNRSYMKKLVRPRLIAVVLFSALVVSGFVHAEEYLKPTLLSSLKRHQANWHQDDPITESMRKENEENKIKLKKKGIIQQKQEEVMLGFPLVSHSTDPGFYVIGNHVDLDPAFPNKLLDYQCGMRTYDTETGYNHQGIDYGTWPFPWSKMDAEDTSVVAAAEGVITLRRDGQYDRNCGSNLRNMHANYVVVTHDDGSEAWYYHLKKDSVINKFVGDRVAKGEFLGYVGSSGQSTAPHLHFEVRDEQGNVIEPSHGMCQTNPTKWIDPKPYHDTKIVSMRISDSSPEFVDCSAQVPLDNPHYVDEIEAGSNMYIVYSFQDEVADMQAHFKLFTPTGDQWFEWSYQPEEDRYASVWVVNASLPTQVQNGIWQLVGELDGKTHITEFEVFGGLDDIDADLKDVTIDLNGSWYWPEFPNQGINLEVLLNNQVIGYWYTYDISGKQRWFLLSGDIDETGKLGRVLIYQTEGGGFLDQTEADMSVWGFGTLTFSDCENGEFEYESLEGEGIVPLIRLTASYGGCLE